MHFIPDGGMQEQCFMHLHAGWRVASHIFFGGADYEKDD